MNAVLWAHYGCWNVEKESDARSDGVGSQDERLVGQNVEAEDAEE